MFSCSGPDLGIPGGTRLCVVRRGKWFADLSRHLLPCYAPLVHPRVVSPEEGARLSQKDSCPHQPCPLHFQPWPGAAPAARQLGGWWKSAVVARRQALLSSPGTRNKGHTGLGWVLKTLRAAGNL